MRLFIVFILSFLTITQALANQLELKGNFVQGGLAIGQTSPGTKIRFADYDVRVSADGVFVIGFHRDDSGLMELVATFADGSIDVRPLEIKTREFDIQRIDGLPPGQVTPRSEAVLKRIKEDVALVKGARKIDTNIAWFLEDFIWPAKGRISGVYGSQRVLNGIAKQPHYGVDVAAPTGSPVIAPATGTVVVAHPDMYYSGGTILLDHGHGLMSAFLHMQSVDVEKGQVIAQGEPLGTIGATGRVTGPHLDWRMNWFDKRIDPQLLVKGLPE